MPMNPGYGQMPFQPGLAGGSLFGGAGAGTPQQYGGLSPDMLQALAAAQAAQTGGATPGLPALNNKYQIPPELQAQMIAQSQTGIEQGNLDRSQKLADQLRADADSGAKGVQAGRRFVAPGWGQSLVSMAQAAMGGAQTGDISQQRQDLMDRARKAAAGYVGAIGN